MPQSDEDIIEYVRAVHSKRVERAQHKLALPSAGTGTLYKDAPALYTPDTATNGVSISRFEELYTTNPVVHKAVNLRANRIIGDGFELIPSDDPNAIPEVAEKVRDECDAFLKKINYMEFLKQSIINALVAGNEWTELIYNRLEQKSLVGVAHGDYKTIDFRRNLINNKILLDHRGEPVGYWQYIEDLAQLYYTLSMLYGSIETYENLKAAKERLEKTRSLIVRDEHGNEIALITTKPNYMFLSKDEIVHLSFNNLNDNPFGISALLPAYNALIHMEQVLYAAAETINEMGYPKPVIYVGDEKHPPTEILNDQAEDAIQDPVRKEGYVLPYFMKIEYLQPQALSSIESYQEFFLNMVAMGLRIPKELLTGAGEANRASAIQGSTDFEKDINADRVVVEKYTRTILKYYIQTHALMSNIGDVEAYIPKIKWKHLITEDEMLRQRLVLERWNAGLITFNEARHALGLNEVEDRSLGDSYFNGNTSQNIDNISTSDLINLNKTATNFKRAEHRLLSKEYLNEKLNKEYRTQGVDYSKIAKKIGTKIKSVGKEKARKIRDIIINSEAQGKSASEIKKKVKKIGNYTDAEVKRILTTEQSTLTGLANLENAKNKGMKFKQWITADDDKTCPLCAALSGQVREIDEDFEISYVENGERKTWKGKTIPAHPSCRCSVRYSNKKEVK